VKLAEKYDDFTRHNRCVRAGSGEFPWGAEARRAKAADSRDIWRSS
jgi:hypothetical protein